MNGYIRIGLQKLNLGKHTLDQALAFIAGIPGVELADLDHLSMEAVIVVNCRVNTCDNIIANLLAAGLTFKRYFIVQESDIVN
ncbi:MAG: hypothetical protein K6T66_04020 [Peptococcaceae bacterium]|nr:hypothetical protein [Peptococcaceae bacterium]